MRRYEKISFEEFKKSIIDNKSLYDEYKLPERKTSLSAGYDFLAIEDFTIKPGEIKKIPTGYKVVLNEDEYLMIVVRSSVGFKYNVRMCNQVGIIDSDYYNNESNEGHMFIALENHGAKDFCLKKGEGYAQGIFQKYYTIEDSIDKKRTGGLGSTNKKGEK